MPHLLFAHVDWDNDMEERRRFIKNGVTVLVGAGGAFLSRKALGLPAFSREKWGMVIDPSRCIGCGSCMIACRYESHTAKEHFNTKVVEREDGKYPAANVSFLPTLCRQCVDPECMKACSNGAVTIDASGIVMTNWDKCDGKGQCISDCPYGARHPDPRFGNRSDKCDFCAERLKLGLQPSCVENCASGARIFGRFDKPEGEFKSYLEKIGQRNKWVGAVIVYSASGEQDVYEKK